MSVMDKAGRNTTEILGYISLEAVEARNLAVTDIGGASDPFVKVFFHGIQNAKKKYKSVIIPKTLNPVWKQTFHSWIFERDSKVVVEVWDYDRLSKDDFNGRIEIPVNLSGGDQAIDQWFSLQGREGKKDKVKGEIHLKLKVKLKETAGYTVVWPHPTYVMVDVNEPQHKLEIQGDMSDDLMAIWCSGVSLPAPQRIYDPANGAPLSWSITIPWASGAFSSSEFGRMRDRMQNWMLLVWNRWRELGWLYVGKNGDDALFLNYPGSPYPIVNLQSTSGQKIPLGYILVDQRPFVMKYEIQGNIDEAIIREVAANLELEKMTDKDGTLLRWMIRVPTMSFGSGKDMKRNQFRYNYYFVKILNILAKYGYIYVTEYKIKSFGEQQVQTADYLDKSHILYRDQNTLADAGKFLPSYVLVEPRPQSWKIALQGDYDPQMFSYFGKTPKQFTDKHSVHLGWEWKVEASTKASWTEKGMKRLENRFQNYVLRVFDTLVLGGYKYVIDIGHLSLFVKSSAPVVYTSHLLVEPSYVEGQLIVEIQGPIDGSFLNEVGRRVGLEPAQDVLDKDGTHLCWSLKIPKTNMNFVSTNEAKRLENRFQNYILKVFDVLSVAGFEYVTAQRFSHLFLRKSYVPTFPVSWLLGDPCVNQFPRIFELQGEISERDVQQVASAVNTSATHIFEKDGRSHLCWSIPFASATTGQFSSGENRMQNQMLSMCNRLYSLGWIVVDRVDTSKGIYFIKYR